MDSTYIQEFFESLIDGNIRITSNTGVIAFDSGVRRLTVLNPIDYYHQDPSTFGIELVDIDGNVIVTIFPNEISGIDQTNGNTYRFIGTRHQGFTLTQH